MYGGTDPRIVMAEQSSHDVVIQAQSVDDHSSTDVSAFQITDLAARAGVEESSSSNHKFDAKLSSINHDKAADTNQLQPTLSGDQTIEHDATVSYPQDFSFYPTNSWSKTSRHQSLPSKRTAFIPAI